MGKQREAAAREGAPVKAAADKAASGPQPEEAVDHGDSVTVAIAKRARALRKKLNHVERLEQSRADGRVLNVEQELALTSRPALEAALDELERLTQVVPALVAEERALAAAEAAAKAAQEHEQSRPPPPPPPPVDRLVAALYVSQLFGDGSAHSPRAAEHQAEREACLAWDAYEAKPDGLTATDLAEIGRLGHALTVRGSQLVSHEEALRRCVAEAATWMQKGAGKVGDTSVERLANRVERVIESTYFRQTPVIADVSGAPAGI